MIIANNSKSLVIDCESSDPYQTCIENSLPEGMLDLAVLRENTEIICCHSRLSIRCWKEVKEICKGWEALGPIKVVVFKFCNWTDYYNIENCFDGIGEKDPFAINSRGLHLHSGSNYGKSFSNNLFILFFVLIYFYKI